MNALAAAAALAAASSAWTAVDVISYPADARCPASAEVEQAVEARVGDPLRGWVARYWIAPAAAAGEARLVTVRLFDAGGTPRLTRELRVGDDGCAAAADAIAAIVERFTAQVAWTAGVPLPEREAPPEPPPRGRAWELHLGAAGRREAALVAGLALGVRAELTPASRWTAAAGVVVPFGGAAADVARERIDLVSVPLRAGLRRLLLARRRMEAEAGPQATVAVERSAATAGLGGGANYRVVPALGAAAALRWPFAADWAATLELAGDVTLYHQRFVVAELGEVTAPRRIQLLALVGIARVLAR